FLTASSWLDVAYGARLREFLLANFRVIAVIESGCESFFQDASINTTITVLERDPDAAGREAQPVRFVQLTRPLDEVINAAHSAKGLARQIERTSKSNRFATHRIRVLTQAELTSYGQRPASRRSPDNGHRADSMSALGASGWGKFLRADEVFFRIIDRGARQLRHLSEFARVRFGVKTGANEFFYVTENGQGANAGTQRPSGEQGGSLL